MMMDMVGNQEYQAIGVWRVQPEILGGGENFRMKILRNSARCKKCKDEIQSVHRHDFKWCKCKGIFVDGGVDYLRRGGNLENLEDTSVVDETIDKPQSS